MTQERTEQFVRLLGQHDREIYRYVLTLVGQRADADDLMQETAASLWRRFDEYDATQPFLPWACRFAYFEVLAWRKRQSRRPLFSDELLKRIAAQRLYDAPLLVTRREALSECMSRLAEQDRALLQQRYEREETIADLARRSNQPAKKLYDALERIRGRLLDCVTRRVARESAV